MNSLPNGYGTFQNQSEIDTLNSVIEQLDNDISKQQKKEMDHEIQAKKIINKYNQNSTRIIQSNHVNRTLDLTEDDRLRAQVERQ